MSASASALRRLNPRTPPRALQSRVVSLARPSPAAALHSLKSLNSSTPRVSRFSTMTSRQYAAPAASPDKSYDPEIKDLANYVHNYNVNSDLAVCIF